MNFDLSILQQLIAVLWFWAIVSMGAAMFGLYLTSREFWRSFWFMNGMWGLVDGAIALYSFLGPARTSAQLAPILRLNAGLDVVYIVVALIMFTRKTPKTRGFGAAVLVQGVCLLGLDSYFWSRCAALSG